MKYERFEDLPVWRAAMDFAERVFGLVEDRAFAGQGNVRDQLQRSSFSIAANIAEGFERGTTSELLMFIYIARGSAGETRSGLRFVERLERFSHLRGSAGELIGLAENIGRQLRGWADSLQNSNIKGQRHLTDASREAISRERRAKAFLEKLQRIQRGERAEDVLGMRAEGQERKSEGGN